MIAHAGHTLVNLAFAAPAVLFIGWLAWVTIRDRNSKDEPDQRERRD